MTDYSNTHEAYCTCDTCHRPHPNDQPRAPWGYILVGAIVAALGAWLACG